MPIEAGRRPEEDPFRVGEKVTLDVKYFNIKAGTMTLETLPFADVNGHKSYHFKVSLKSSKFFDWFYKVNDWAETYVDYNELTPYTYRILVKESKQFRDIRSFFDFKKDVAHYWETRITTTNGTEEKKINWNIKNFSQNVVSAAFYLRTFDFEPGKELAFKVADDGKNYVFTGKVLRREVLETPMGDLNTVVIKPKITVDGMFKPVGDILFWLTDDDRKFIVRIESQIRIGTIVAKLKSIDKGD